VQDTPNINMTWAFNIKHLVWIAPQRPMAQAGKLQFMRVTRRSRSRMPGYPGIGVFQRINESKRGLRGMFVQIIGQRIIDVLLSLGAQDNRRVHQRRTSRIRARKDAK